MNVSGIRNTRPILVTGAHRSGTTWVGRMIALSPRTCYLGEVFNLRAGLLDAGLLAHWYQYVTAEKGAAFEPALKRILAYDFCWPGRGGMRRLLPTRLVLFRWTRRWWGLPRPILKDPFTAMSAEWLAATFPMDVLCLVRHPAGFVDSLKRVGWRFGFDHFLQQPRLMEDWLQPLAGRLSSPPSDIVEEGALLWLCVYHVLLAYAERQPEWLCWRVEDISHEPVAAFEEIYDRLDLAYPPRIQRQVMAHSSPDNPVEAPPDHPHLIRRDSRRIQSRWRDRLTADEIARIRDIVEPVAARYYGDADW